MKDSNLTEAIKTFKESHQQKSESVFLTSEITEKVLNLHKGRYAQMGNGETPLLAVNKKIVGTMGGYGWSGLLITDKKVYYKCVKDSFICGLIALSSTGEINLDNVSSIRIADHDHCFGTAYIGHQLVINGNVVGLLRMGGSMEFDEKAIGELNQIFSSI